MDLDRSVAHIGGPANVNAAFLSSSSSDIDGPRDAAMLEGALIEGFRIGGELRLCLPQLIYVVLRDFSLSEINVECDRLHIYCSRCTPAQLRRLKLDGILPNSTPSCGLITQSDAERLCAALLGRAESATGPHGPSYLAKLFRTARQQIDLDEEGEEFEEKGEEHGIDLSAGLHSVPVYHECFGICYGTYYPALYKSEFAPCIECDHCKRIMSPQRFVCHTHDEHPAHPKEHRTCHWGFESAKWRAYILLDPKRQSKITTSSSLAQSSMKASSTNEMPLNSSGADNPKTSPGDKVPPIPVPAPVSTPTPIPIPTPTPTTLTERREICNPKKRKLISEYHNSRSQSSTESIATTTTQESRRTESESTASETETSSSKKSRLLSESSCNRDKAEPLAEIVSESDTRTSSTESAEESSREMNRQAVAPTQSDPKRHTPKAHCSTSLAHQPVTCTSPNPAQKPSVELELLSEMKSRFVDSSSSQTASADGNSSSSKCKPKTSLNKPQASTATSLVRPSTSSSPASGRQQTEQNARSKLSSQESQEEEEDDRNEEERSWERYSGTILKNLWRILRSCEFSGQQSSAVCLAVTLLAENGLLGALGTPLTGVLPHPTLTLDLVLIEAYKGLVSNTMASIGPDPPHQQQQRSLQEDDHRAGPSRAVR